MTGRRSSETVITLKPMTEEIIADVRDYSRIMGMRPEDGAAILASLGDRFLEEFEISRNRWNGYLQKGKGHKIHDAPDDMMQALNVCEIYRATLKSEAYTHQEWKNDLTLDVVLDDDLQDTFRRKARAAGAANVGEVLAGRICLGLQFVTRTNQYRDELDRLDKAPDGSDGAEQAEGISKAIDWADKKVIKPVSDMLGEVHKEPDPYK